MELAEINDGVIARWSPPVANRYKLNCDASFMVNDAVCELGMVVRNSTGEAMVSAMPKNCFVSMETAELGLSILVYPWR